MPMPRPRFRILRRSRALITSREQWRGRMVFWCGALLVGLVSTAFAKLADLATETFRHLSAGGTSPWLLLALPAGFISSGWVAQRYFPGAQGSGIPQAIAARALEGEERRLYLTLRIAAGKFLLTLWGLLCGASIGREGPTVQIGAAIMLASARVGHLAQAKGLILAGSAAGIAAAFNTPLAGIVFAIEEMARTYQSRTNGLVLSTVVIAGIAALAISGSYTYFGEAVAYGNFPRDWLLVGVVGIAGGALGAGFSRSVLSLTRRIRRWKLAPGRKLVVVAGAAGLAVAVTGLLSGGMAFGTSYGEARLAVQGEQLPASFFLAKLLATLASTVSGIPGGLFAPSLSVGAGLGNLIGGLFSASLSFAAVLGMAAYFAGVVQSPMTAFVIVMEMTATQEHALPIMAAAMLGFGVSRLLSPEPLYHGLARLWLADALKLRRREGAA
ncbi:chloride channel protein [Paracoccus denitrificans]|uniref:Cl-channel, voltage-gated family protein n=3 Tax=Paracoccus TaxID=265 RepID=A1B6H6_PARDP|nr:MULTISPECIES: chloride channel protein [Paracoccus]ABL71120.1 Cl- channel, voltage-gated family protein [Paracoccus denitrificans PD1222]MBB4628282.1 H+/Cl- antiporter ClcA [Paracoccus denitrificans]MCU7429337.1 chloride channel protein [Paracoccus denitrificans]QLH14903.1 chloride channel protein [Paracoccus pantotrophus]WQO35392.1 chloride channel protein [Paracoccus denitrificans]